MAKRLKPGEPPLDKNGLGLSVVVYWQGRQGIDALQNGHAALIINADKWMATGYGDLDNKGHEANKILGTGLFSEPYPLYDRRWYVSWLGGQIDWTPSPGSWGGNKGVYASFWEDMAKLGGEQIVLASGKPISVYYPTRWVAISGLNTANMYDAWDKARKKQGAHWNLFSKNCATMVHTILKAGGGDQLATGHKKQLVWWPTDIIRYAKSMTGHVHSRSITPTAAMM